MEITKQNQMDKESESNIDIVGVTGSIPVRSTIFRHKNNSLYLILVITIIMHLCMFNDIYSFFYTAF
jgi:hypothetical protein